MPAVKRGLLNKAERERLVSEIKSSWTLVQIPSTNEYAYAYCGDFNDSKWVKMRGIYFLYMEFQDRPIWIGKSENIFSRLRGHKLGGRSFDFVLFIVLGESDDIDDHERTWISRLRPSCISPQAQSLADKHCITKLNRRQLRKMMLSA